MVTQNYRRGHQPLVRGNPRDARIQHDRGRSGALGKLGVVLLNALGNVIIAIGWTMEKLRMGIEWTIDAYCVGRDIARGVNTDEGP